LKKDMWYRLLSLGEEVREVRLVREERLCIIKHWHTTPAGIL
jgi:hypothetical protein